MESILIKWVNDVNWRYADEWSYNASGWTIIESDGEYILNKNNSSESTISRNILNPKVKYKVTFELTSDVNDEYFGSVRMNVGGYLTPYYSTPGQYTYISTNPTWMTYFSIFSTNDNSKFGIKNLRIESLSYEEIDLYEGSNISLTYSISDIREYYNRNGVYSKNITIPGTERNLSFFGYIQDENINSKININKKFNAILKKDDIEFKSGFITIESVDRYDDRYEINIIFFGEELNLFKDFRDDLVDSLDYSDLDHIYTKTKLYNSWLFPTSGQDKIVYPWLDYGNLNWSLGGCIGKATDKYPSLGLVGRDFYPGVSLNYYIDKFITSYGYDYEFDLGDEDWFKKIFIPYSNQRENLFGWNLATRAKFNGVSFSNYAIGGYNNIDGTFIDYTGYSTYLAIPYFRSGIITSYSPEGYGDRWIKNEVELYRNFNYGLTFNAFETTPSTTYIHPDIIAAGNNSPINFINTEYQIRENVLPGSFSILFDNKYKFKLKFKNTSSISIPLEDSQEEFLTVYLCKLNKADLQIMTPTKFRATNEIVYRVGYYELLGPNQYVFHYLDEDGTTITNTVPGNSSIILERDIDCVQDEMVYFKFVPYKTHSGDFRVWKIIADYFEGYEWEWGEGNQVYGKDIVPADIKIKDFFKDILLMFNLYVDVDENNSKKIYIKTREEYYNDGEIIDISDKLDLDSKIELKLPSEFQNTINILKYKSDDEFWTKKYDEEKDISKIGYGSKRFIIDNDNISGTNIIELSTFASSPLWSVWGINGATNKEQFVMTSLWNNQYPKNEERQTLQTNWTPRLLFFNKQLIYDNNFSNPNNKTTFLVNADNDYYYDGMAKWYYPYAGHILNPYDLTGSTNKDLNFNTSLVNRNIWQKTFKGYPENTMTGNNLFNLYYLSLYNQLSSKNSRLFTAYFNLNVNDILKLKLNSTIQINNSLYYINKIEDFNPSGEELTKIELLKIIDKVYPNYDIFTYNDRPIDNLIEKEPVRTIENIVNNSFVIDNDELVISSVKSINQKSTIIDYDSDATYIDNLKISKGEILSINKNVDGGLIENDGVFNPILFRDKHVNDAGLIEDKTILDINIWKLRDGGLL